MKTRCASPSSEASHTAFVRAARSRLKRSPARRGASRTCLPGLRARPTVEAAQKALVGEDLARIRNRDDGLEVDGQPLALLFSSVGPQVCGGGFGSHYEKEEGRY